MIRHLALLLRNAGAIVLLMQGGAAVGQPITSSGLLLDGVPQAGSVSSAGFSADPITGQYWRFFGFQGDTVTIQALRLEQDLDPALWVFEGALSDVSVFGDGNIDGGDPGFLDFADDELANPGPFGDPLSEVTLTLPGTGVYTAIVTNFASGPDDGGDGFFDYEITAFGVVVPEPHGVVLLAAAAGLLPRWRRC